MKEALDNLLGEQLQDLFYSDGPLTPEIEAELDQALEHWQNEVNSWMGPICEAETLDLEIVAKEDEPKIDL